MRRWLWLGLGWLVWVASGEAYLDLVTAEGLLFRTVDGTRWTMEAVLPHREPVGYTVGLGGEGWILTRQGVLLYTSDDGRTWQSQAVFPASDFVGFDVSSSAGNLYALTASGTFWRTTSTSRLAPVSALPGSDFVDLVLPSFPVAILVALTRAGDVYVSLDDGATWQLRGNTGMRANVAVVRIEDTLLVLTDAGTLLRSVDTGRTWMGWATLSQVGAIDLHVDDNGRIFGVLRTGELAEFHRGAGLWEWVGTPSQMTVVEIATGGVATFEGEEIRERAVRVRPFPGGRIGIEGVSPGSEVRVVDPVGRELFRGVVRTVPFWLRLPPGRVVVVQTVGGTERVVLFP